MNKLLIAMILGILLSQSAFAARKHGQENEGGGLCETAKVLCHTADGATSLCVFEDFTIVWTAGNGNDSFKTHLVPVPKGMLGAGIEYQADGFDLHVQTDTAPRQDGIYSILQVPSLQVVNQELTCVLRN